MLGSVFRDVCRTTSTAGESLLYLAINTSSTTGKKYAICVIYQNHAHRTAHVLLSMAIEACVALPARQGGDSCSMRLYPTLPVLCLLSAIFLSLSALHSPTRCRRSTAVQDAAHRNRPKCDSPGALRAPKLSVGHMSRITGCYSRLNCYKRNKKRHRLDDFETLPYPSMMIMKSSTGFHPRLHDGTLTLFRCSAT